MQGAGKARLEGLTLKRDAGTAPSSSPDGEGMVSFGAETTTVKDDAAPEREPRRIIASAGDGSI